MPRKKLILICQTGGEFSTSEDGSMLYVGGEAHAVDANHDMLFDDLKLKVAEMCNLEYTSLSLKYFIPGNKRTLITLSSDKDLKRMFDFYGDAVVADVFVTGKEGFNHESAPDSRVYDIKVATTVPVTSESKNATPGNAAFRSMVTPIKVTPIVSPAVSRRGRGRRRSASSDDTLMALVATAQSPRRQTTKLKRSVASDPDVDATENGATTPDMGATPADTVKRRRRTASWKIVANGPTIGSVSENAIETKKSVSLKRKARNQGTDSDIVDVYVEQQLESPGFITGSDFSYLTTGIDSNDPSVEIRVASWKNGITGEGQEFKNVAEFRDVLQKYAIARRFGYRFKKNDTKKVSVICAADGCSWKIQASWVPSDEVLRIRNMEDFHSCGGESWKAAHPSKSWLVNIIKERLRETPHQKPKDIANGIYKDFGIELNYTQVWRGLGDARVQLQGSHKEAYGQLPWFCDKLVEANPGSFAKLVLDDEKKFQHLFVSFSASITGFQNGCRPLIFLDSTTLKSKYHEMLLTATGIDGNDDLFPVSFAVVDIENDVNWVWFLEQLKSVILTSQPMTFVSDKDKGLQKSVLQVFENAHHGYSLFHLLDSFVFNLKGPFPGDGKGSLLANMLSAVRAVRPEGFRFFMDHIKRVSPNAYDWAMQSEPEYWASAFFKGERYDQVTTDVAELYIGWIEEVWERPLIQKLEALTCKIMELICTRQTDSTGWITRLTPSKERKVQEDAQKARYLKVLFSSDAVCEVHDDCVHVVNTEKDNCTCGEWEVTGLPCRHAIAVFISVGKSPFDFCSKYFTVDNYRVTYSGSITPVLATFNPPDVEESAPEAAPVHPPSTPRPPPLKRHKMGEFRRTVTCTKCKGVGHNKVTCKERMPGGDPGSAIVPSNNAGIDLISVIVPHNDPGIDSGSAIVPSNDPGVDLGSGIVPSNDPGIDPASAIVPGNNPGNDPGTASFTGHDPISVIFPGNDMGSESFPIGNDLESESFPIGNDPGSLSVPGNDLGNAPGTEILPGNDMGSESLIGEQ